MKSMLVLASADHGTAKRVMTLLALAASALWLEVRLDWAFRRFRYSRGRWQRLRAFNALRDLAYLREQVQRARRRERPLPQQITL